MITLLSMAEQGSGERLQKVLARSGLGSRRICDELIEQGRVEVDGKVARLGMRIDAELANVEVDGVRVAVSSSKVYYLLNKPCGVVTTSSDPQGRPTVVELVPNESRVFPVGRLDMETEGLLILTNDGALSQLLSHPSNGVDKEYLVQVKGVPSPGALRLLRQGVELSDGMTRPARVGVVSQGVLRVVIHEGRNRQIRRMCEAIGYPVERLIRVRIGSLSDPSLTPGSYRPLTQRELITLTSAASKSSDDGSGAKKRSNGTSSKHSIPCAVSTNSPRN